MCERWSSYYRSPGHQVDGGSFAEILVRLIATRCVCRIAAHLRAVLAAHVSLQLVDRRRIWPSYDGCERHFNHSATMGSGSVQFERSYQLRRKQLLRRSRAQTTESAMSEAEFDRLLDVVRTAIEPRPSEDFFALELAGQPSHAANDNELEWPLIPFPDGWHASC